MDEIFDKGAHFIWGNTRLLERVIFEYRFLSGSGEHILAGNIPSLAAAGGGGLPGVCCFQSLR